MYLFQLKFLCPEFSIDIILHCSEGYKVKSGSYGLLHIKSIYLPLKADLPSRQTGNYNSFVMDLSTVIEMIFCFYWPHHINCLIAVHKKMSFNKPDNSGGYIIRRDVSVLFYGEQTNNRDSVFYEVPIMRIYICFYWGMHLQADLSRTFHISFIFIFYLLSISECTNVRNVWN